MSDSREPVGACGLYCGSCGIYLAERYPYLRRQLAKNLGCREEDVRCQGCDRLTSKCWGAHCKILACARSRGYRFCYQCDELPCTKLHKLSLGYGGMPEQQLAELKELGLEKFLLLAGRRWTCHCGHPISAYTNQCINCG